MGEGGQFEGWVKGDIFELCCVYCGQIFFLMDNKDFTQIWLKLIPTGLTPSDEYFLFFYVFFFLNWK